MMRRKSLRNSFKNAHKGVVQAIFKQSHMFYLMIIIVLVILLFLYLRISYLEWLILFLALSFPIMAELFNTAFEVTVDHLSPHYNPSVKLAKDVAAGAVLVSLTTTTLVTAAIFLHRISRPPPQLSPGEELLIKLLSGLFLLFASLGILKVLANRGKARGRVIDEKTSLAFFVALSLFFLTHSHLVLILLCSFAFLLILFQWNDAHRLWEASFGSLLGVLISLFLFLVI